MVIVIVIAIVIVKVDMILGLCKTTQLKNYPGRGCGDCGENKYFTTFHPISYKKSQQN